MPKSELEATFELQLRALGVTGYVREHRFAPPRRWRFDFAWPDRMLAVELEGGAWSGGRHTRGQGFEADCEKYNAAALAGWRVLRYTGRSVEDWTAAHEVKQALEEEATCISR